MWENVCGRDAVVGSKQSLLNTLQTSNHDERTRATLRIVEEANELKRKEQELRRTLGYSVAKDFGLLTTTSRNQNDHRRGASASPSTLPKYYHSRISSDGNNNAFASQRSAEELFSSKRTSAPRPTLLSQPSPVPKPTNSIGYTRGAWNGSLHSSLTSLVINNEEAMRIQKPPTYSPQLSAKPFRTSPQLKSKVEHPATPTAKSNTPVYGRVFSSTASTEYANITKTPPSAVNAFSTQLEEEEENVQTAPQTPIVGSNIRKVKEAVKQQTLGQKSASKLLLQGQRANNNQLSGVQYAGRSNAYIKKSAESPKLGRSYNNVTADQVSNLSEEEISNNIAKILKEGLPTLKKIGTPVEKNGVMLGKVLDDVRIDNSMVRFCDLL
ncbi:unnamed protein product [Strongylus vulgaris]|uniref:Uncharacterized protein n=1 Tax=Strongylus vulgaris TaxID=40348 RepID=A0A3P7J6V6_STRVU|nr:unnamed protein product [Strongylus vulgaris]